MIRGYFTPYERVAIALESFNPAGSFAFPVIDRIFSVPSVKEFLVAPRDNPMTGVGFVHIQIRSRNVPSYLGTGLKLPVLDLHVTRPKFPLSPGIISIE
jgi:hypothetical protein